MEISNSFITPRSHSWQAHLGRISSYLVSKEVWWKTTADGFSFHDADSDPEFHSEGPSLFTLGHVPFSIYTKGINQTGKLS